MSSASAFYDAILSSILLWSKTIVLAALLVHVPSILKALLSNSHSSSHSSTTKNQPKSLNDSQHQAISDETFPSPPPVNCSGLNINVEKNEEVTRKLEPRDSVYSENNFHVHQVRHSRPSSTNYECGDTFSSPTKESTSRLSASHQSSFSSDFEHDDNMVPLNLLTGDDFSTGDEVESYRKPELDRSRQEDNTFIIKSELPSSASTQSSTRRSIKRKPVPSLDFFSLPPHIPKSVNESAVVASSPSVCGSIASTWVTYESDHPLDSDIESTHTSHRHQNSAVRPPKRNRPTRRPVSSSSTSSVRIPTPDSSNESNSDYSSGDVCDLSSKELTEFPLVPTNVAKLLLDYNNIYSIPSNAFQEFSNLEVLDLSSNRLPDLPDSIGSLGNLKELYLRGNLLLRLPDALERLTNLEILDVSCNELYELGPYLRTMTSLQQIDVRHNKLRTLPSELGLLINTLTCLLLDGNQFESFYKDLTQPLLAKAAASPGITSQRRTLYGADFGHGSSLTLSSDSSSNGRSSKPNQRFSAEPYPTAHHLASNDPELTRDVIAKRRITSAPLLGRGEHQSNLLSPMIYKESSLEPISERRNSAQSDLPELPPLSPVGALFPDLPVPSHHRASAPQVNDSELRGYPSPHPPRTVSATSSVCSSPNVTPASPPLRRPSTPPISISSANPISPIVPIPPVIALQNADNLPTPLSTPQLPFSSPNLNSPSPNGKSRPSTLFSLFSRKKSHDFSSSFNFSSQSPADITSLALKKLLEYLRDMYDLDETNSQENLVRLRRREWDVEKDVENGDAGQVIDEPKTTEEEEEEKRKKKLKKQENIQRRHKIVAEILSTEQTYISELDKLVQIYLNPLESAPSPSLLTSDEIRFVFSNIRSILQFHQDYFYKGLQKVTDLAEQSIGKVFVEHGAFFKMYSVYINNFDKANSELEKWVAKRKKLKAFMQKCATHPLHTQFTIQSYLILPIQRIPRYRLLLQDLLDHTKESHPDYGNLVRALEEVEKRAKEINESKRNHDLAHKIVQIQSRIKGTFKAPLVQPHRRLIREGTLKVAKFVKLVPRGLDKVLKEQKIDDEFWFCLFNDILIQCKPDGEKLELWRTLRLNTKLEPATLIIPSELANSHFPMASTPSICTPSVSTPQISSNQLVQNYLGSSIPTPGTPGSVVSCNGSGAMGLDGKVWMRLVDAHVILYLSGDLDELQSWVKDINTR